jgi:hypothetical protein
VELGYDYCLKVECQQQCLERVQLAAVGVNKAADYYQRADEVLPPAPPRAVPIDAADCAGEESGEKSGVSRPAQRRDQPPVSTFERLRAQERKLDEALARSYERFRDGEITASEMDREHHQLVEAFNRQVKSENIRYRSLLRRQPFRRD